LAKSSILEGSSAGKRELTALAQAKRAFVLDVFYYSSDFECHAFASIVHPAAPKPDSDMLRKDYSCFFERFFYFLEDHGSQQGIVVFDELEKSQNHILLSQNENGVGQTAGHFQTGVLKNCRYILRRYGL
jgi:hypothetical protein